MLVNPQGFKIDQRIDKIFRMLDDLEQSHPATGLVETANGRSQKALRTGDDRMLVGTTEMLDLAEAFLEPENEEAVARYKKACIDHRDDTAL